MMSQNGTLAQMIPESASEMLHNPEYIMPTQGFHPFQHAASDASTAVPMDMSMGGPLATHPHSQFGIHSSGVAGFVQGTCSLVIYLLIPVTQLIHSIPDRRPRRLELKYLRYRFHLSHRGNNSLDFEKFLGRFQYWKGATSVS